MIVYTLNNMSNWTQDNAANVAESEHKKRRLQLPILTSMSTLWQQSQFCKRQIQVIKNL